MNIDKVEIKNKFELYGFILVYFILFVNAIITKDSVIALVSAFCGITYTILAGKGFPICYLIGVVGSVFYSYLSFKSALWGNLILYALYYVPMQITGFFHWNKNLKSGKKEIIKIHLKQKERFIIFTLGALFSFVTALVLAHLGDKNPLFDSVTTVFSILGMYLTVRRAIEQWIIWIIVNGLSFLMWLEIACSGTKVYSTVIMWGVYFILAMYFFSAWKKEVYSK